MRAFSIVFALLFVSACGSPSSTTAVGPTRYNFAVVEGGNQRTTAGASALGNRITSQLARSPQGKFALSDLLLPPKAYAQSLGVQGEPVAGALVCAREAGAGEPQAVPLCAFTLADGKAPIEIKPGTKAGVFNVTFSAQVQTQEPVKDSTTVTVQPGPANPDYRSSLGAYSYSPALIDADAVRDSYGNAVPYRIVADGRIGVKGEEIGTDAARTLTFDSSLYDDRGDHWTELRGADDAVIGYLRYYIIQGANGQPQLAWKSSGVNTKPGTVF